jgi:hypothetical protein
MGTGDDPNEHRVATALRDALPTRRHGEMLFDMAADLVGAAARVEASPDGNQRTLYRLDGSDPRWVIPWPLLTLDRNPRNYIHLDLPGIETAPPLPPRPGQAPRLRGLGPGSITLQDGVRTLQVAYAEDGRWFETSRHGPPTTLEGVLPLLAAGPGPAAERLAEFMVALDTARNGPLRVFLPVPDAWSAVWAWRGGLKHLRLAVARGAIPPGARWAATDPVDGTALAFGATRDEALSAWQAEVESVRPGSKPPPRPVRPSFEPPGEPDLPPPPDEGEGKGRGRTLDVRLDLSFLEPDPSLPRPPAPPPPPPGVIPAVLIPLPDLPPGPAPLGGWRRFLGGGGATVPAALREDPAGWTLVGAPALAALRAPDVESAMDEAERNHDARFGESGAREPPPESAWTIRLFRLLDDSTGSPCPPVTEVALKLASRDVPALDGDVLALGAARLRRTKG